MWPANKRRNRTEKHGKCQTEIVSWRREKEQREGEMKRMRVCFNPCSAGVSIAGLSPVLLSSALFHVHNYGVLSIISKTVLLGRRKITDLSTSANRININISLLIYSHSHPKYLNEPWQRENAFVTMKGKQRRTNGGKITERETDRDKERRREKQKTLRRNNSLEWDKSKEEETDRGGDESFCRRTIKSGILSV